jgi:hypothetical protein
MFDVVLIGVHEEFKFSCSPKAKIYTSKDVFLNLNEEVLASQPFYVGKKIWFVLQKCLHEKDLQEPIVKFPKTKGT